MNKYISWVLLLWLAGCVVYLVTLSQENEALRDTLISTQEHVIELEDENGMIVEEFQVAEVRICRSATKTVLEVQANLDSLRERKDEVCWVLINKPADLLNPQWYYDVIENEVWGHTAVLKY